MYPGHARQNKKAKLYILHDLQPIFGAIKVDISQDF